MEALKGGEEEGPARRACGVWHQPGVSLSLSSPPPVRPRLSLSRRESAGSAPAAPSGCSTCPGSEKQRRVCHAAWTALDGEDCRSAICCLSSTSGRPRLCPGPGLCLALAWGEGVRGKGSLNSRRTHATSRPCASPPPPRVGGRSRSRSRPRVCPPARRLRLLSLASTTFATRLALHPQEPHCCLRCERPGKERADGAHATWGGEHLLQQASPNRVASKRAAKQLCGPLARLCELGCQDEGK